MILGKVEEKEEVKDYPTNGHISDQWEKASQHGQGGEVLKRSISGIIMQDPKEKNCVSLPLGNTKIWRWACLLEILFNIEGLVCKSAGTSPVTRAFFLFPGLSRVFPSSGPLSMLFPVSGMLLPEFVRCVFLFFRSAVMSLLQGALVSETASRAISFVTHLVLPSFHCHNCLLTMSCIKAEARTASAGH